MYLVKEKINGLVFVALMSFISSLVHAQDGVWRDSATGLSWMRCSIGQNWTGKTCIGEPVKLTWQDALDFVAALNQDGGFVSRTDWRVPTIKELSAIRECSNGWELETVGYKTTIVGEVEIKGNVQTVTLPNNQSAPDGCANKSRMPAINASIFPNTKSGFYWSSSSADHINDLNDFAWFIYFGSGHIDNGLKRSDYYVRLVRSSQ